MARRGSERQLALEAMLQRQGSFAQHRPDGSRAWPRTAAPDGGPAQGMRRCGAGFQAAAAGTAAQRSRRRVGAFPCCASCAALRMLLAAAARLQSVLERGGKGLWLRLLPGGRGGLRMHPMAAERPQQPAGCRARPSRGCCWGCPAVSWPRTQPPPQQRRALALHIGCQLSRQGSQVQLAQLGERARHGLGGEDM